MTRLSGTCSFRPHLSSSLSSAPLTATLPCLWYHSPVWWIIIVYLSIICSESFHTKQIKVVLDYYSLKSSLSVIGLCPVLSLYTIMEPSTPTRENDTFQFSPVIPEHDRQSERECDRLQRLQMTSPSHRCRRSPHPDPDPDVPLPQLYIPPETHIPSQLDRPIEHPMPTIPSLPVFPMRCGQHDHGQREQRQSTNVDTDSHSVLSPPPSPSSPPPPPPPSRSPSSPPQLPPQLPHNSASLLRARHPYAEPCSQHSLGEMKWICTHCKAPHWFDEHIKNSSKTNPRFGMCCLQGQIKLPPLRPAPTILQNLLCGNDPMSKVFLYDIRQYNAALSFTSLAVNIDEAITNSSGPYCFHISGELHHRMGSLLPQEGKQPTYAQLYIHDPAEALSMRNRRNPNLRSGIMSQLQDLLQDVNPYVALYRHAYLIMKDKPHEEYPNIEV
ncbi:hypothetical protein IW262DRAFT_1457915 [Armillaria fumosa]|nr:hypothetical protein IW262DRAFT_1457915 [Armillaria fumosa]